MGHILWSYILMKTTAVPFADAKAHLSKYGRLAEQGRTTLVLKHRRAAFLITPVPQEARQLRPKKPGIAAGCIHVAPDFDRTPDAIIDAFEGKL